MFFVGVFDLVPNRRKHPRASYSVRIEAGPCSAYNRSDYVQHISVINEGPQATFSAQVTSNFVGLESAYGKGNELVWERPQATEKRLGKDQEGLLRLVSIQPEGGGGFGFTARFFASPEFRHKDAPGSYLPTMPYTIVADTLTFDFCVRNIDRDLAYKRSARITLAPDGRPTLEVFDPRVQPASITAGKSIHADGEISATGDIRAGVKPVGGVISASFVASREQMVERIRNRPALERASRRFGVELREMRLMIERLKATNPMAYPPGFRLPVACWAEYEALLAEYADLHGPIDRAYAAARGVNDVLRLREARQGDHPTTLAVNAEDGLDATHGAAGEALDALGERHNEPFKEPSLPVASSMAAVVGAALAAGRKAEALSASGQELDAELWRTWKRIVRSGIPIRMVPADLSDRIRDWNAEVIVLADQVLTTREQAEVATYPAASLSPFVSARQVSDVIQSNLRTLGVIRSRCR